jgi:hypothetical protein
MASFNSIPEEQNEPRQLERLGAFSQLYLGSKRFLGLNMVLSVPMALIWALIVAFSPTLEIYAAVWGIAVTLLSIFFLTPTQKKLQTQGAKAQWCRKLCWLWSKVSS